MSDHREPDVRQLAELYRRGVCVPLDDEAEGQLRSGFVRPGARVRHLAMDDDAAFYGLWSSGVVRAMNAASGAMLDEHEESIVEAGSLGPMIEALQAASLGLSVGPTRSLCENLAALLGDAARLGRPSVFVL